MTDPSTYVQKRASFGGMNNRVSANPEFWRRKADSFFLVTVVTVLVNAGQDRVSVSGNNC